MTTMSTRLVATATGITLLLSAAPAFAMSAMMDVSSDVRVESSTDSMMKYDGKKKSDASLMMRSDAHVKVTKEEQIARMHKRILAMMKRVISHVVKTAAHVCAADSTTDETTCMANAKASLKTEINALIDVSFGS